MKRFIGILALSLLMGCSLSTAASSSEPVSGNTTENAGGIISAPTTEKMETNEIAISNIKVSVGEVSFVAIIENSETGKAFLSKLPLTLDMNELHGNEKYHYGVELPTNAKYFDKVLAGNLMLYGNDCLVLFYGDAGGYSYTPIGKLKDTTGLSKALGSGNVKITFSK